MASSPSTPLPRPLAAAPLTPSPAPRARRPRVRAVAPLLLVAALALPGCSAAEEGARSLAGQATASASAAAISAVTDQICTVVDDGQVSEVDVTTLDGLVDAARAAGLDSDLLTAVEDVTGADGTPPESAVAQLVEACG